MKRLFIVLIKYIPIIQMVGMLFNNILYCFSDIYIISYILDFIIGNSISYNPCHIQSTTPTPAA